MENKENLRIDTELRTADICMSPLGQSWQNVSSSHKMSTPLHTF